MEAPKKQNPAAENADPAGTKVKLRKNAFLITVSVLLLAAAVLLLLLTLWKVKRFLSI